ncbi:TetR family transcriptional regulator [Agromyces tardus]|jgi:AcrR family transcriptional regulator|uniref:TetR family transcriptional regulator n=1 Tax=Agromyces tardus TaxID=2583849 RepID=A0A3M8AFZ3_9MICO|nr:TetR/AcrR family transcriptional regulator [Agromyces tardus]RNB50103.1 TetR family transcriptional regulator [Agromyces tardus]
MPRWPADSRARLASAALELFTERGYSAVTVDDIAERAGVTARTFFRQFRDKEEVLFSDDDLLLPTLLLAIAEPTGPVDAGTLMERALGALAERMEPARDSLRRRQEIIDSDVALTGRELAKQARWQQEISVGLVERGFDPGDAGLLAAIGFALFRRELHAWLADPSADAPSLSERLRTALPAVRTVLDSSTDR